MAMDAPFTWMEMITPRNRNAGSNVQKGMPKSSANPGHSLGSPTQGACITLSMS